MPRRSWLAVVSLVICLGLPSFGHANGEDDMFKALDRARRLVNANRFTEAELHYQEALRLALRLYGENHRNTAAILNNLANLHCGQGQYGEAEPLYRRSLRIYEKVYGSNHPDVANALINLANLYLDQGRYGSAEPVLQRCLRICEKVHGPNHPDMADCLSSLASLYRAQGRYGPAEPLCQRSLRIYEKVYGPAHPNVAIPLNNLASLYHAQRQYGQAEPLFQRSLTIQEKAFGPNHPRVVPALNNLAVLHHVRGRCTQAEALFLRALRIEESNGPDHPNVALALNNLARLYRDQGQYAQAESLYQRSLRIYEKAYGPEHPATALTLNNLADLYRIQVRYGPAEPLFQRSLTIREKVLGPDHPAVATTLHNLASLYHAQGKHEEATGLIERLRRATRLFLLRELPYLPDAEQQQFLQTEESNRFHLALSLALRRASDAALVRRSAEWLLNGKAIGLEALALRTRLEREAGPQQRHLVEQLQQLRAQEARLALRSFDPKSADSHRKSLELLQAQRREVEQQLAHSSPTLQRISRPWIELNEVRKALPPDSVLIDIARFRLVRPEAKGGEKEWDAPHYAAWLIPALGRGEVALVDLGEAEPIESDVLAVRRLLAQTTQQLNKVGEVQAEQELRAALEKLAKKVLHPLLPGVGDARRLLLSPDGALWLAPWSALPLPDGKYAVEKYSLTHLVSGRDLVRPPVGDSKPAAPLVLADPDFDLLAAEESLAGRTASGLLGKDWQIHVEFQPAGVFVLRDKDARGQIYGKGRWSLEGASLRAETEKSLYQGELQGQQISGQRRFKEGSAPAEAWRLTLHRPAEPVLVRQDSLRSAVRLGRVERLPYTAAEAEQTAPALKSYTGVQPRVLTDRQALVAVVQEARSPRVLVLCTHGFFLPDQESDLSDKKTSRLENPLLRCGLLLAGCNHADQATVGQNTGVLTGLQIVGCDLRGTELVVLSACETGLGVVRNGEGVAGLRQAFQLAGARSVAATLWQIPDRDSAQLMIGFFDNLAHGQSKADALRHAQLARIKARRDRNAVAHPFFWAAFTLTGQ